VQEVPQEARAGPGLRPGKAWVPLENGFLKCYLCVNRCTLAPGTAGNCRVRVNSRGRLYILPLSRIGVWQGAGTPGLGALNRGLGRG